MKRASLIIFAVLFIVAGQAVGNAWYWPPSHTGIVPEHPISSDVVAITLGGDWPDSCVPNASAISVMGNNVYFDAILDYPPGIMCLTMITPWGLTRSVGPLPAGAYTVYVCLIGDPSVPPGYMPIAEFTVTAEPCTYYVDAANGNDLNDGLTPETAFATIQKGVDTAKNEDTVIVMPGVYTGSGNRDIDFSGRAITLRSESGPENCIIDCENQWHRSFYLHSGEDADSIISGFTIKRGKANMGAGIYCSGSSPTIENCIVTNNIAQGSDGDPPDNLDGGDAYGGGLYCTSNSNPRIINCTVSNNKAIGGDGYSGWLCGLGGDGYGGGIFSESNSNPIIENCTMTSNTASGGNGGGDVMSGIGADGGHAYGAAIFCGMDCQMINCTISNNQASGGDGCFAGVGMPPRPPIIGNGGHAYGGAVYCDYYSELTVENCIINDNKVTGGGGYSLFEPPFLTGHGGSGYGGAIYCYGNNVLIIENCTISDNTASGGDGEPPGQGQAGTLYSTESTTTITNSIIWDDAFLGPQIFLESNQSYSVMFVYFSDVQAGQEQLLFLGDCILIWHSSNIDTDPLFTTGPLGNYYLSQVDAGQAFDSPCVDTGSDTAANVGLDTLTTRTDGLFDTNIVDMGYHYHYPLELCTPDIDGDGFVNFIDYALFAADYGGLPTNYMTDLNISGLVDIFDLRILVDSWLECFIESAYILYPANNAFNVNPNVVLSWSPGNDVLSHDIYFGTDYNGVNNASFDSNEYMGNQFETSWDTNNYSPDGLSLNTTHFWRIDEVGLGCTTKGDIWNFTTWGEPNAHLVSHWRFDEGEGDTAYDSVGGNHGTLDGPIWTDGIIDGALSFNGDGDYISLSSSMTLSTKWTFSAWLKTSYEGGTKRSIIIGGPGTYYNYLLIAHHSDNVAFETNTNGDNATIFSGAINSSVGEWALYTITRSGNTVSGYKNGAFVDDDILPTGDNNTINKIAAGYGTSTGHTFWGLMDDVRVYDRALNEEEIWQLYWPLWGPKASNPYPRIGAEDVNPNVILRWSPGKDAVSHDIYLGTDYNDVNNATPDSNEYMSNSGVNSYDPNGLQYETTYYWRIDEVNDANTVKGDVWGFTTYDEPNAHIVSHWRFDEGEGDTAYDSAGSNHGILDGPIWTTGQIGGALGFDGENDYVGLGDINEFEFGDQDFSICAWFYTQGPHESAGIIINKYDYGDNQRQWSLHQYNTGELQFYTSPDGSTHEQLNSSGSDYIGRWVHVACVREGSTKYLYIDGLPDVTGTTAGVLTGTSAEVYIGCRENEGVKSRFFDGLIDDVRVYDRALDAGEIWQLYQEGL